ncbi:arsenite methyltransferase-like [Babylonia areolata]|uniref:arsenite methyltransferase-like n=1 Tax=Babylonia areolata TaxID=304850 RepID=UPI003FD50624
MSCCQNTGQTQPPKQRDEAAEKMGEGEEGVWDAVKQYYGGQESDPCQTGVNCTRLSGMPRHLKEALSEVHEEVSSKYYGCGVVIPEALEGCSILDLGSGTGRDCYAISKLVGSTGHVTGVDMTDEQLAVARKHVDYHTKKFGFTQPNVDFIKGNIEKLSEAGLKENSFDIIISNCVINLCPEKGSVLKEAFKVLKEGGELYFSDIYTDADLSPAIRQHRRMWGECLAGALLWQELYQFAQQIGFSQPRLVSATNVDVSKFTDLLGEARFVSVTYRLFKLPTTASAASTVTYNGGIKEYPDCFTLDHATAFKKNEDVDVDGEVATILSSSRFRQFFSFSESGPITPVTADPKVDPFQKAEKKKACC